jgi:type II secretory pathway pseudopilin PulG
VKTPKTIPARKNHKSERGFALLMVVFAVTLMVIVAITAAPGILTEGKREREKEMIWRGNQYVRGIKMYYRKTGKFPANLEDLTKPQVGNIRFMRQAYKDPMNKEDGSWRLIYVGPSGQLIGSLKPQPTLLGSTGIPGTTQIGTPAANLSNIGGQSGLTPGGGGATSGNTFGNASGGTFGNTPGNAGNASGAASTDTDNSGNSAQLTASEGTPIFGGNIIGVGSKARGRSVIVYDKATNYHLFEFYWDPSKDAVGFGPRPNIPGTATPGTPAGAPGAFGNPGTGGTNPQSGQSPTGLQNPPDPSGPPTQGNPPQN